MSIEELTIIYNKWGKDNNIDPLLSADDLLSENTCNRKRNMFLIEFIEIWQKCDDVERFIYEVNK